MGLFNIFSKKKKDEAPAQGDSLDLPPPPSPDGPSSDVRIVSELPDITSVPSPPLQMREEMHEEPPAPIVVPRIRGPAPMPVLQEEPEPEAKAPSSGPSAPMFINANEYQEVITSIAYVRAKLGEADALIKKLNDVKSREEKGFEQWQAQLEDLQRKLAYVEDVIVAAS